MTMTARISDFLAFLGSQRGAPPSPFETWASFRAAIEGMDLTALDDVLAQTEQAFVLDAPPPNDTDYASWSEQKRIRRNAAAMRALNQIGAAGASLEQIRLIQAYTGFGGIRDIGLLSNDYPPEYVQASRDQIEIGQSGGILPPTSAEIIGRVRDQYFTGLDVCTAVHSLLTRTNPTAMDYLEPSAGVGRFLRTAPAGKTWTAVELDAVLSRMVTVCHPSATVRRGYFEEFAPQLRNSFDVVVGNPPYGKRMPSALDKHLGSVDDAVSYFFLAGAACLRPGGTLAYLVPVSFLTNAALATYRRTMLSHCVFRGAALLPSSIFPTVYPQTYAIVLFTRRASVVSPNAFSDRERAIIDGDYLALPEAVGALCGGSWQQGPRGMYLGGAPDFTRFASLWLAPGPEGVDVRPPVEPTPSKPEAPPEAPPPEQKEVDAAVTDAARALADRVQVWIGKINKEPQAAEDEREAIRNAVVEYLASSGNPHPRGPAALRAVVTREGGLEPVLTEPVLASAAYDQPPEDADNAALVAYWTERKGYADLTDLGNADLDEIAKDDRICIDLRADGAALLPHWAYFTGSPASILANLDRSFANPMLSPAVRARLESQKAIVLQHWSAPKTLVEIDPTPRSPFVSLEVLNDWLNSMDVTGGNTGDRLYPDAAVEDHGPLQIVVEDTIARLEDNAALTWLVRNRGNQLDPVYWLLSYVNRMRHVDSLTEDGVTTDAYGQVDAAAVLEKDRVMIDKFQAWLADSQWVAAVEADYNTKFAPQMISQVPSDAVVIAGQSAGVRLHPHQNQIVRRLSMGGKASPFLWGADVGAGKCRRASSLMLTSEGLQPIGTLFGDNAQGVEAELVLPAPESLRVLSYVNGRPVWSRVRSLYRQRISDQESTVTVRTERGSKDEVTRAHPFPVIRRGEIEWVPAGALVAGDVLAVPAHLAEPEHPAAAPDDDLCEIMGWLVGDGHEHDTTAILTQADVSVLERVLGLVEARYGRGQTRTGLPWARIEIPDDGKHVPYLSISIPAFKQDLLDWDYPWGTLSSGRRLPRWALGASDHKLRTLLRAYMDADGSPAADACAIEVASASPQLADDVRYALLRFGVRTTRVVKMKVATNSRTPVERPYVYLSAFGEDAENFHRNVGFGLPWKTTRLSANAERKRNPNNGLPIGDLAEDLAECGVSIRMLTGFVRQGDFRSASRETVDQMVTALHWRLSSAGAAEMALTPTGRKKLAVIDEHREVLQDVLVRLRSLRKLSETMRFEVADAVEVGRSGGFVYDIEVEQEDYDDQNYVAGDGGLLMHNTYAGTATAMRWRQIGAARRCIVSVPTSVIAKWYDDGKRIFPNARIGLIGITPLANGKGRSDGPDVRLEKWLRFAAGAYDYVICGHETFERDIEPSVNEVADVMVQDAWARRGKAKQASKFRRIQEKIEAARKTLASYQAADNIHAWKLIFDRIPGGNWATHRAGHIAKLNAEIEKNLLALEREKEKEGALGTDAQVISVQEQIIRMCTEKTYRPNTGSLDVDDDEDEDEDEDDEDDDGDFVKKGKKGKKEEFIPLPGLIAWGDLGIDALIVDEAHRFKNLRFPQDKVEYAGGGQDLVFGVKKAWDMFIKTRLIHRRAGGVGGVLFLTATPTVNSPLELYSLLDMVNPRCWEDAGIWTKQDFIDRFWDIKTEDVPSPDGSMKPRPALKGFQHGDELVGMIRTTFQRLSIAELVTAGWLRSLPSAEPERLYFQRDPAQIACIRTLGAIRVAWTKAPDGKEEVKRRTACGLDELVPLIKWGINVDKNEVYQIGMIDPDDRPDVLENRQLRHLAIGTLSLVWQHLVDKIATSPMLIMRYDAEVRERHPRIVAWLAYREAMEAYRAERDAYVKARGQATQRPPPTKPVKPTVPKPEGIKAKQYVTAFVTSSIALGLLDELPLDEMRDYYAKHPVVPKIAALARIVAANVNRAIFRAWIPSAQVLQAEEYLINQIHARRLQPYLLVRVEDEQNGTALISGPSAQVHQAHADLRARGVKLEPVREQGRCGHVVFCEYKELHDQIRDAIVKASNGEIQKGRIVFLPDNRPKRLLVSKGFNGADATSLTPAEEPIYDVVIGTSKLMAEGIDLQRRSCAVHHLDLPWDPATLHQRNGRAVRQGNLMGSVDVIYYLTEKSYDSIRFDKIAKKAMWWDALFSGQSYTSNPAADKDGQDATSLDELILSMVVEDPEVLKACILQLRQEREIAALAEAQAKAARDWLTLNALYVRARSTTDETRRGSAFALAARKLEAFKISYKTLLGDADQPFFEVVARRPVAVDWRRGDMIVAGATYGDGIRVLDLQVKPKDFLVELRAQGDISVSTRLASSFFGAESGPDWTYADERKDLIDTYARTNKRLYWFAYLPADLWEHAVDLWNGWVDEALGRYGGTAIGWCVWSAEIPLLVTEDDRVVILDNVMMTAPPREVDLSETLRGLRGKIKRVLPLRHPDARGVWLAALRSDRVLALPRGYSGSTLFPKYHHVQVARAPLPIWAAFHRRLFGAAGNVGEVLRQRAILTEEPKEKHKPAE